MDPLVKQQTPASDSGEKARSEPFPPGTTIARYRLVSLLGSGAMGDVYRAHDRALDREVALKVLPPELTGDRERVHRFAHEARATSALSHPHIVAIHEVGHARPLLSVRAIGERRPRAGEVHYIAMELIDGNTLREQFLLTENLRDRIETLAQVADGLAKAHTANILHRDLKPDNILVSRDGYAKIVDFGLAKLIDTSWNPIGADSPTLRALTAHGELLGTPGYMSPEQVTGKPLDARADIFAFGCILYEAIAGKRAFEAESFIDTLYKIVHEEPAPIDAPPELLRIVNRCLEKHREDRYQSIREIAADLRAWNAGVPPARPAPSRRRATIITIAALIAALPILAFLLLRTPSQPKLESTVRRITSEGRAITTAISPDGRYVAYVTSGPKGQTLSLEQLATGRTLVVAVADKGEYSGITFSPDGEYIYFSRYDQNPIGLLYRVSILGGDAQPVVKDVDTRAPLSPDGKQLAFARDDYNKATTSIFVASADGSNPHVVAAMAMPDRFGSPAWSPDGDAIVAARQSKLIVVELPKGNTRTIETSVRMDAFRGVAWPQRDRIIAAATTDSAAGRFRLWNIDPKSGDTTPITSDLADLNGPSVSTSGAIAAMQLIRQANVYETDTRGTVRQLTTGLDAANGLTGVAWIGDRIVYTSTTDGKPDLWTLQPDHAPMRLTDDASSEAYPLATPDGSRVLYLAGSPRNYTIWSVRADGTDRHEVTSGPRDGDFAVSPDSKQLAWATLNQKTNTWGLWTMPLGGGPKKLIATSASVLEYVRYTPDGKSILYTGIGDSLMQVYRVPLSGGHAVALTDARAHDASMSPDGRQIVCSYSAVDSLKSSLATIDANSGKVTTLNVKGRAFRYLPDGKTISFVTEENGVSDLWLQPADSGAPHRLTHFSEGSILDYAWNASGTRAVISHVVDSSDVVLLSAR
jgi:serine/threonine protein kinase/Tol biopolymer transport system component